MFTPKVSPFHDTYAVEHYSSSSENRRLTPIRCPGTLIDGRALSISTNRN